MKIDVVFSLQAVEELFQLMHFFAAKDRNMSEKELRDVTEFKQNTLLPFFKVSTKQ